MIENINAGAWALMGFLFVVMGMTVYEAATAPVALVITAIGAVIGTVSATVLGFRIAMRQMIRVKLIKSVEEVDVNEEED